MEFWAVMGLACLDHVFLSKLVANKVKPEGIVREYGFRLTRWELAELIRVLSLDKVDHMGMTVVHHMGMICHMGWAEAFNPVDNAPCPWSAERSAVYDDPAGEKYVHPLRNNERVPK